ncbi:Rha family phage regulatory protein [Salmonella enterica]|uniref:Rha family phage regulatory protein n=3 Tax=Salmonella enterica TaxID=28901 RepID=UPI001F53E60E|nr:Rha family phage regulatory protein [Salmonella enterica]WIF47706.1 Rha family transcriptional regulator [Salmonella enterica subsp. enterica]
MRFSEIAAIHLHSFNKVLISGSHTQWKLIHLNPDFLVVVLNSVVHRCKHNKIVMFVQCIDSAIPGRYTVQAPHKAGAGRGNPEFNIEHNRAHAVFSCHEHCYAQIMVGRAGPVSAGPGSMLTGISTPVRLTTYKVVESLGGEFIEFNIEAATMATVPTLAQPEIRIINGQAVTSSLAVADYFIKRHADVIRKIESLECSTLFRKRNFAFTSISVNQPNGGTRKLPCYQITRDGFAFLAMGFTGKRAAQFKEAYINAFNQMEKQLSKPSVLSDAAHNASVLYSYISSIHQVWLQQLYPMLEKVESPLAVNLYDRINDAAALASLINMTLNRSEVRGRK